MIHLADVAATLTAYDPETTTEQLYQQMDQAWQNRAAEIETQATNTYKETTGHWPNGPQRGQIITQAKQLATDQIMGEYLEPLTQQIVQHDLDNDEQDNPHLQALRDPNGWWQTPDLIQPSQQVKDLVWELWEDETAWFSMLAERLLERRLFLGLELPNSRQHPDYPQIETQLRDAEKYWMNRTGDTQ